MCFFLFAQQRDNQLKLFNSFGSWAKTYIYPKFDPSGTMRNARLRTHKKEIDIGEEDEMRSLFYG
jgi:activator of HSP90 ATPase